MAARHIGSLSLRRAWIEIYARMDLRNLATGRSPYGERGLKLASTACAGKHDGWSLSLRRAWIEMNVNAAWRDLLNRSLSLRRAWIEITKSLEIK